MRFVYVKCQPSCTAFCYYYYCYSQTPLCPLLLLLRKLSQECPSSENSSTIANLQHYMMWKQHHLVSETYQTSRKNPHLLLWFTSFMPNWNICVDTPGTQGHPGAVFFPLCICARLGNVERGLGWGMKYKQQCLGSAVLEKMRRILCLGWEFRVQ